MEGIAISIGVAAKGIGGAGSVVVNVFDNQVSAKLVDSDVISADKVTVQAKDTSHMVAGAGALGIGAATTRDEDGGEPTAAGIGASVAVNVLTNGAGTLALVQNSDLDATGDVMVKAETFASIEAVGVTLAASFASVGSFALAAAISVSVNSVSSTTRAAIDGFRWR